MVSRECPANPREASGLDPEAVHPSANHTRFEHSLGVYHLADTALRHLDIDAETAAHYEADTLLAEFDPPTVPDLSHELSACSPETVRERFQNRAERLRERID